MSEVVFAGCRSIAVNAATRISVNGSHKAVCMRDEVSCVYLDPNSDGCGERVEWMDISSVSVVERR